MWPGRCTLLCGQTLLLGDGEAAVPSAVGEGNASVAEVKMVVGCEPDLHVALAVVSRPRCHGRLQLRWRWYAWATAREW
ncbi:hypothetical protein F5148DRAFT_1259593, partial [Russula earlei]